MIPLNNQKILFIGSWIGFIVAISFFEAWVKFQADSLVLQVGIDVGKTVFNAKGFAEIIFLVIIFIWIKPIKSISISLCLLLIIQLTILLPLLNTYAIQVIAGESVKTPWLHICFGLTDIGKIILLIQISKK